MIHSLYQMNLINFYNAQVEASLRDSITKILDVRAVMGIEKYLGLPSMVGRSRKEATFDFMEDQIWYKINS